MPSAKSKKTRSDGQTKTTEGNLCMRFRRQGVVGLSAKPEQECDKQEDGRNLGHGEHKLDGAAWFHAKIINGREQEDGCNCQRTNACFCDGKEVSHIASQDHSNGGNDSGVHAPEHGPSPEKAKRGRKNLFQKDVNAASLRIKD